MIFIILSSMFICILAVIFRYFYQIWWNSIRVLYHLRRQGIQGPTYKILHGNTKEISDMRRESMSKPMDDLSHDIFPRIMPEIHSWKNLYGPNFLFWSGPKPQLVITEVKLVKEILTNIESYPKVEFLGYFKKLFGDGLVSSKGEKWAKMRKLADPVFHGENLKNMMPDIITSVEEMLVRWKARNGKEIEVFEEFKLLTSDIISKTAFGSSYMEGKNIFEMLMTLTSLAVRNVHNSRNPGIRQFLKKSNDEIESERLEQGIKDSIVEIIKKREQDNNKGNNRNDFLGKLIEAKWLSVEDMVDECKTFYFAGYDTTTSMLGWTIFLLALHKDWQEKAREEVIELFGQNIPEADGISRMKILNMILDESLRLYPPGPMTMRKVNKQVQLGRLSLLPETEVYISMLALQHDPETWGEDVHLFKPERFAQGVIKATNNNPAAFLPFIFGPRNCVGSKFAVTEAKIAVSMILQRYQFTLSPTYLHSPMRAFTLIPQHGVQVILHAI